MVASAKKSDSSDTRRSAQADQVNRLRVATGAMLSAGNGERALATLLEVIVSLQDDNERLLARLNTAIRSRFGRRSEKLDSKEMEQLVIAFGGTQEQAENKDPNVPTPPVPQEDALESTQAEDAGKEGEKKERKRRKPRNKTVVGSEVPRVVVPIPVPDELRNCIHCGTLMAPIGHVDHESIEFHPARFEVVVRRCEKIACKQCKQDICTADDIPAEQARAQAAAALSKAIEIGQAAAATPVATSATVSTQTVAFDSAQPPAIVLDAGPQEIITATGTPVQAPLEEPALDAHVCTAQDMPAEQGRIQATAALSKEGVGRAVATTPVSTAEAPSIQTVEAESEQAPEIAPASAPQEAGTDTDLAGQALIERATPQVPVRRRAGASLLAHLIESKCDDSLPIYRQRDQFSRSGVTFPLNTLYSYWMAALAIVSPIAEILLSAILGSDIVGVDDTKLDFLDPSARSRQQRGHLWCFASPGPLVAFDFTKTWCAEDIKPRLSAIDGFIQCDDYKGYGTMVDADDDGPQQPLVPPERRLGCSMHVRRRFHKAFKSGEKDAIIVIGHIKTIYEVEAEAKERGMDQHERLHLRQDKSMQALGRLYEWVDAHHGKLRPTSYLAEAVNYAHHQRPFIERCFTDGRFEIDNGRVEREIKKPAVGRKNYLFSGSPKAAALLAGGYGLVGSCRHLGVPTRTYLMDVITRLEAGFPLKRINELRPDLWAIERGLLPDADYLAQQPAKHPAPH